MGNRIFQTRVALTLGATVVAAIAMPALTATDDNAVEVVAPAAETDIAAGETVVSTTLPTSTSTSTTSTFLVDVSTTLPPQSNGSVGVAGAGDCASAIRLAEVDLGSDGDDVRATTSNPLAECGQYLDDGGLTPTAGDVRYCLRPAIKVTTRLVNALNGGELPMIIDAVTNAMTWGPCTAVSQQTTALEYEKASEQCVSAVHDVVGSASAGKRGSNAVFRQSGDSITTTSPEVVESCGRSGGQHNGQSSDSVCLVPVPSEFVAEALRAFPKQTVFDWATCSPAGNS